LIYQSLAINNIKSDFKPLSFNCDFPLRTAG
jgi:hypothetical protein